jgi:hypothetical protein
MQKQAPNEENGGMEERYGYTWTQNDDEVTIQVPVPEGTSAKSISVVFDVHTLSVGLKNAEPFFKGKLYRPVREDECTWSLEGKSVIAIYLQKVNSKHEEWWPCVIEGHQEIDLKAIKPPPKHVNDLDEGAIPVIQKMMFDQQQKRQGLPTSDELMYEEAIKKAGKPPGF